MIARFRLPSGPLVDHDEDRDVFTFPADVVLTLIDVEALAELAGLKRPTLVLERLDREDL